MFGAPTNSNYFNSYSSLEPDQAVRMNGDGRTLSAPDIARNTMRGGHGGSNSNSGTLSSAARRRMEDRMFTREELFIGTALGSDLKSDQIYRKVSIIKCIL